MAAENAQRDQNNIPTLLAVSNEDGVTPTQVYADPDTHRLLVDGVGATGPTGPTGGRGATGPTGPSAVSVADGTYTPVSSITVLGGIITAIGTAA